MEGATLTVSGACDASIVYELADCLRELYHDVPGLETDVQVHRPTPQVFLLICDKYDFFRSGAVIVVTVTLSELNTCRVQIFAGGGRSEHLRDALFSPQKKAVKEVTAAIRKLCGKRGLEIRG